MGDEFEERLRLQTICGELLGRPSTDLITVQVARVLQHISSAGCEGIRESLDVVSAFRTKGLIPSAIVHLCTENTGLAVAFASCIYPQRAFQLSEWERQHRFQCFVEVFQSPGVNDALGVVHCLRAHYRLPVRTSDDEVMRLLSDLCSLDSSDDQQDRTQRLTGGALYLATLHRNAIDREASAEPDRRGVLWYWADDREFVRFLRSNLPSPPPRPEVAEQLWRDNEPLVRKAVDLERIFWGRKPSTVASEDFAIMVADFWGELYRKLTSGFLYYRFESHFFRWWLTCVDAFIKGVIRGQRAPVPLPPGLPDNRANPEESLLGSTEANTQSDQAKILRAVREGWRLVRTTFFPLRATDPAVDNEARRRVLDELWKYHLEKDITKTGAAEEVKQVLVRTRADFDVNTAYTCIDKIRDRMRAYNFGRLKRLTNQEIKRRLRELDVEVDVVHTTVASLARLTDLEGAALWPVTAFVFLRPKIDPAHKDPWGFQRWADEFWHWVADPGLLDAVIRGAAGGIPPHAAFLDALDDLAQRLAALTATMNLQRLVLSSIDLPGSEYPSSLETLSDVAPAFGAVIPPELRGAWSVVAYILLLDEVGTWGQDAGRFHKYLETVGDLCAGGGGHSEGHLFQKPLPFVVGLLRRIKDEESFHDVATFVEKWATRLVSKAVGACGLSAYENMRPWLQGTTSPEWIVPIWYVMFVEEMHYRKDEEILARLTVDTDPEETMNVRRIIKAMRLAMEGKP